MFLHLNIAPAYLVRVVFAWLRLHSKDPFEQSPVGPDPEVALVQHDETCYVLYRVRCQVVQLDAVGAKYGKKKGVQRKGNAPGNEIDESYSFVLGW